jgi:aminopeptidase-like protein
MSAIAVALDQISGSGASSASDHNSFSAADQAAADATDYGANDRSFSSAVVNAPVSSLAGHSGGDQGAEYQNDTQE